MDVRLSAEQQALRDSVAHAVDRTGPKAVADLGDHERAARLDATSSRLRNRRVESEVMTVPSVTNR